MIHIKCKKCGYRLPFSTRIDGYTAKRIIKKETVCPKCGEILIKKRKKIKNN